MSDFRGSVQVNNLNLGQGSFPEVERTFLFIGVAPKNQNKVLSVDTQTDLDVALGVADSVLKTNIEAAKVNAGQNWQAFVMPLASDADILDAIDTAMLTCSPEIVVVTTTGATATANDVEAYHAKAMGIRGEYGRQVAFLLATTGIDTDNQTWADYFADKEDLIDSISANRVAVIPQLHGNDLGVLAGRLCDRNTSIADSPMRVRTGTLIALGEAPVDSEGVVLPEATLSNLSRVRYSTVQHYPDYPGVYWADCPMLEVPTGDYKVVEYLRIAMKAARNVRLLAIYRIADRLLNSTPQSIESHKLYFSRPLREMAASIEFGGYVFPGEIRAPDDDAITIVWLKKNEVKIGIVICPTNSPKKITLDIILDLTTITTGA